MWSGRFFSCSAFGLAMAVASVSYVSASPILAMRVSRRRGSSGRSSPQTPRKLVLPLELLIKRCREPWGCMPVERAGLLSRNLPPQLARYAEAPAFPSSDHLRAAPTSAKISSHPRKTGAHDSLFGEVRTCDAQGVGGNDVTFVEAALSVPCVLGAISVLWLLAYLPRSIRQDRMNEVRGLDDLDELGWKGWSLRVGWSPWTCWPGCKDLHRDDWWRAYLHQTCWPGCEDLHRDDWWRAYVDQPG